MNAQAIQTGARRIGGLPGIAVRLGHALETWGRRAAAPIAHDELVLRRAIERDAALALAARDAADCRSFGRMIR